jgi:HEAT repeat protein
MPTNVLITTGCCVARILCLLVAMYLPALGAWEQESLEGRVQDLIRALKEQNRDVRKNAAVAIEKIGPAAKAAVPALIVALKDPDDDVRHYAAEALGRIGGEARDAVEALGEALQDKSKDVRQSAAWALGKIGTEAKGAAPALIETLKDQDKDVRLTAAWSLGITGAEAKAAVPILIAAMKEQNESGRQSAARVLGRIGADAEPAIPILMEALRDQNLDVRRISAVSLSNIAIALQHVAAVDRISELRNALHALEVSADPDVRNQSEVVRRAVDSLERQKAKSLATIIVTQIKEHPIISLILAAEPLLLLVWLLLFWLNPLLLLRINENLKLDVKISNKPVEIGLPLRYLILVGFFQYRRRVLDKWVQKNINAAREGFSKKATVEEREVFVSIPVICDKENLAQLTAEPLRAAFKKNRSCLLIWGEGGAGKTSLACEIGRWSMSEDRVTRVCEDHFMIPILLEQDFNFPNRIDKQPFLETVRGHLTDLIDSAETVSGELVTHLLRQSRLLVIIDSLSELSDDTRKEIRPANPDFPANALIVTSRANEALDKISRTVIQPLRIQGDKLSSFMEAYLTQRGKRDLFNDPEYFDACRRLSLIVGDRNITVLLAKLYAEQMIANKEGTIEDGLPENIPDLILYYLNELNRQSGHSGLDNRTVHYVAKSIAWECIKQNYRPAPARREEILFALAGEDNIERLLSYLEEHLRIIQTVGPSQDRIRFAIDPIAEYLAGLWLLEKYREHEEPWQRLLTQLDQLPDGLEAIKGFLLALRDCCLAKGNEFNLPSFLADELAKRAGLDPEQTYQLHLSHRIQRLIYSLEFPDVDDRTTAAQALGRLGAEARAAIPVLAKTLREDLDDRVRISAMDALRQIVGDAKSLSAILTEAMKDKSHAVRASAIAALTSVEEQGKPGLPKSLENLDDNT